MSIRKDFLVECIPNVSTSNPEVIQALEHSITSIFGCRLLNVDTGVSANRTVFTFTAPMSRVFGVAERFIEKALELIDMRDHVGVHPRFGAVDVFPFVNLEDELFTPRLVEEVASFSDRIAHKFQLPIYAYEHSSTTPARNNLADVRRGEYESLPNRFSTGDTPDFGPQTWSTHTAKHGACALGVRNLLIAYNVNIDSPKGTAHALEAARAIAKKIRARNGGLPGVKAIGWFLPDFDQVQVSCNITQYQHAGVLDVYRACEQAAIAFNATVSGSELIGCMPASQLDHTSVEELGLNSIKPFSPRLLLPL